MSNVTIHLKPETKQSLLRKANEGGQTLETYLEEMIQRHLHGLGASANAGLETDEEEIVDRPWRGVFVPVRPRQPLFPRDLALIPDEMPKTVRASEIIDGESVAIKDGAGAAARRQTCKPSPVFCR